MTNTEPREPRQRRRRRLVVLAGPVLVLAPLLAASCAPPSGVTASSPFVGQATQGVDGRWEGNLFACTTSGGPVTTSLITPLDTVNPYEVQVFSGWGSDPGRLITTGPIAQYSDVVVTPPLAAGSCFHVRMSKPAGQSFDFWYEVRW